MLMNVVELLRCKFALPVVASFFVPFLLYLAVGESGKVFIVDLWTEISFSKNVPICL